MFSFKLCASFHENCRQRCTDKSLKLVKPRRQWRNTIWSEQFGPLSPRSAGRSLHKAVRQSDADRGLGHHLALFLANASNNSYIYVSLQKDRLLVSAKQVRFLLGFQRELQRTASVYFEIIFRAVYQGEEMAHAS